MDDEVEWSNRLRDAAGRWFDRHLRGAVRSNMHSEIQDSVRAPLAPDDAAESQPAEQVDELRTIDVVQTSLDAMQAALTRHRLAAYQPDHLIAVPRSACRVLDFHRAQEMIDLGRRLAEDSLAGLIDARA